MSDIDDFFAKRLDEEAPFPNRGKGWKQMSGRLDAFDVGMGQGKGAGLRLWQALAVVAVVGAGLLLWKVATAQRANSALRQEVAGLQNERAKLNRQLAEAEKRAVAPMSDALQGATPNIGKTETDASPKLNLTEETIRAGQLPLEKKAAAPSHLANAALEKLPEPKLKNLTEKDSGSMVLAEKETFRESETKNLEAKTPLPADPLSPSNEADIASDGIPLLPTDIATKTALLLDSLKTALLKMDSLLAVAEAPKDSMAAVRSLPDALPVIEPVRVPTQERFRAGAHAVFGFVQPKQAGISVLRGQGIAAELRTLPAFWLTASADLLNFEVGTKGFEPKFHPYRDSLPEPPNSGGGGGGGHHHHRLVAVESDQQQLRLGLGLRYVLPLQFWAQPSVRVAHEWVRTASASVIFKYEEDHGPGPGPGPGPNPDEAFVVQKTGDQWLSNQWRFGIGLEKEMPHWTFGISADYSKNFSKATPAFDALYLRAGLQYKF